MLDSVTAGRTPGTQSRELKEEQTEWREIRGEPGQSLSLPIPNACLLGLSQVRCYLENPPTGFSSHKSPVSPSQTSPC